MVSKLCVSSCILDRRGEPAVSGHPQAVLLPARTTCPFIAAPAAVCRAPPRHLAVRQHSGLQERSNCGHGPVPRRSGLCKPSRCCLGVAPRRCGALRLTQPSHDSLLACDMQSGVQPGFPAAAGGWALTRPLPARPPRSLAPALETTRRTIIARTRSDPPSAPVYPAWGCEMRACSSPSPRPPAPADASPCPDCGPQIITFLTQEGVVRFKGRR